MRPDEQSEHVVEAAEHRIEAGDEALVDVVRCPECGLVLSLADAARHDHMRVEATV